MKTFAILAFFLVGALAEVSQEDKDKFRDGKTLCLTETGIDPDVVEKSLKGKVDKNDEKLACFMACMMKKFEMMKADGTINDSKLKCRGSVGMERATKALDKCKALKGVNDCERAMKIVTCLDEEDCW